MRIFGLLLKRDFFIGVNKVKKSFLLLLGINLLVLMYPIYVNNHYNPDELFSFWDVIGKGIGGTPIVLVKEKIFEFPYTWLLLQLCIATAIGNFIKDDLFSHSCFVYIRAKSIWKLWVSKVLFCLILTIVFYILLFLLVYCAWNVSGKTTNEWTIYSESLIQSTKLQLSQEQMVLYSIILNFSGTVLITIIYSTLSLIMRTVYSYIVCVCILFSSVFSDNYILLGNESMLVRQPLFGQDIFTSIYISITVQFTLSLMFVIIGGIYLLRLEIFGDNNEE
ncbi:hypothetical protein P4V58_14135 [Bacillus wiedmannii]|uniref:hypothetical protein n=1 Tax=Bacillus wiedmannii TaxID=1890302 RepID=UPI002E21BAAE|nr:hypothetical protein [Bacillus wiedmannii]